MHELGELQLLKIKRFKSVGAYLGKEGSTNIDQDVLLPKKELTESDKVGTEIEVFLYKDHQGRIVATRKVPLITLNKIAYLEVKDITNIGAFLDWGLEKDLFLPFKEQLTKLQKGRKYLVALYIDKSDRLCATMRIRDYLRTDSKYKENDAVKGIVYNIVDSIGAFIALDNTFESLLPIEEFQGVIAVGEDIEARVASVKKDGRINLSLKNRGYIEMGTDSDIVYDKLIKNGGFIDLNDKSEPDKIKSVFNMSKAAYKRAVGRLLKLEKITFHKNGIKIISRGVKNDRKQ